MMQEVFYHQSAPNVDITNWILERLNEEAKTAGSAAAQGTYQGGHCTQRQRTEVQVIGSCVDRSLCGLAEMGPHSNSRLVLFASGWPAITQQSFCRLAPHRITNTATNKHTGWSCGQLDFSIRSAALPGNWSRLLVEPANHADLLSCTSRLRHSVRPHRPARLPTRAGSG